MDNTKKSPTCLSLCTGYGGIEKGIELVLGKLSMLAYVEIEAFAIANLVAKMESGRMDPAPIWTDVKTFDAIPFQGCVDLLIGGYPCQPFSFSGKRKGSDDSRHLWPYFRTIIVHAKPKWIFFENVEGHLTKGITEVLEDLESLGYKIAVGIFSAVEVGAPHQRKRVFIMGNSESDDEWWITFSTMHRERIEIRGSSCNMAYTYNSRGQQSRTELRTKNFDIDVEIKPRTLADDNRCVIDPGREYPGWKERATINKRCSRELANAGGKRLRKCWGPGCVSKTEICPSSAIARSCDKWPARPGQQQFEWEEPRVVADTENVQRRKIERSTENGVLQQNSGKGKAESQLGGTIDGARNRVDRLRLLGNGVVPQVAAKAFYYLSAEIVGVDLKL